MGAPAFLQEVRSESQGKWSIKEPHVQALLDFLYCEETSLTPYAGGAAFIHAQRWELSGLAPELLLLDIGAGSVVVSEKVAAGLGAGCELEDRG